MTICICGHHERYHDEAVGCVGGADHCNCERFNMACRRCSDCEGHSHHWIADQKSEEDEEFEPGDYCCKHCPQRGLMCPHCDDGIMEVDGATGLCAACQGEGVMPMTDEEYDHEMQLWADPQRTGHDVGEQPQ